MALVVALVALVKPEANLESVADSFEADRALDDRFKDPYGLSLFGAAVGSFRG